MRVLPVITTAGRYPLDDRNLEYLYRGGTYALHLYEYTGTIRLEDRTYRLQPGDVTVSPAHHRGWYDVPAPGHHWCIHFRPTRGRGATVLLPWHLVLGPQRTFVTDRMAAISRLHNRPPEPTARAAAAVELQGLLLRVGLPDPQHFNKPFRRLAGLSPSQARLTAGPGS